MLFIDIPPFVIILPVLEFEETLESVSVKLLAIIPISLCVVSCEFLFANPRINLLLDSLKYIDANYPANLKEKILSISDCKDSMNSNL